MVRALYVAAIVGQILLSSFSTQAQTVEELSVEAGLSGEHRDSWSSGFKEPIQISPSKYSVFHPILKLSYFVEKLDLVEFQQSQLDTAFEKCDNEIREISVSFRQASENERPKLVKEAKAVSAGFDAAVKSILLPHQLNLLKHTLAGDAVRRQGFLKSLHSGEFSIRLKMSSQQKESIESEISGMREEIDRLKEKFTNAIAENLTTDQKSQLEEILGEKFRDRIFSSTAAMVSEIERFASKPKVAEASDCCGGGTTTVISADALKALKNK
jgi:succinate dehydrogenase flavin-adding protein (antitoxin of CptAB toxin-antitoxin module)